MDRASRGLPAFRTARLFEGQRHGVVTGWSSSSPPGLPLFRLFSIQQLIMPLGKLSILNRPLILPVGAHSIQQLTQFCRQIRQGPGVGAETGQVENQPRVVVRQSAQGGPYQRPRLPIPVVRSTRRFTGSLFAFALVRQMTKVDPSPENVALLVDHLEGNLHAGFPIERRAKTLVAGDRVTQRLLHRLIVKDTVQPEQSSRLPDMTA